LDFIFVLQTEFGSGFLPLGSGLDSDSKKLESEHLWQAKSTEARRKTKQETLKSDFHAFGSKSSLWPKSLAC